MAGADSVEVCTDDEDDEDAGFDPSKEQGFLITHLQAVKKVVEDIVSEIEYELGQSIGDCK